MFGLLNLNKPAGLTSREVVNRVQRLVKPMKAGHAGTLDPLATGVLVVCLGQATRLIRYVQELPKHYRATFLLGRESDTDDVEGTVRELSAPPVPTVEQLVAALPHFVGTLQQRPPTFSAIKVQGRRAYALARRGEAIELAPRPVQVYSCELVAYTYPELVLEIACGSGTYIRALGRDLAASLGTAAVMSELVRTAIGPFRVGEACLLAELTAENLATHLLPASRAVAHLPAVELTAEEVRKVSHGMTLWRPDHGLEGEAAACDPAGRLIAILAPRDTQRLRPRHTFARNSSGS